jgi:hypothetical protein
MDFLENFKAMLSAKGHGHEAADDPIVPTAAPKGPPEPFNWSGDRPPNDSKSFPSTGKQGVNIEALIHALAKTDTKELDYKKLMSILQALKDAGLDD